MEITSFILGVCAVIAVMMVVGTFVNYMRTVSLKKEINSLQKEVENLYRDLETKESQLYSYCNELNQNRVDEQEKLYRHIDSRVDKMSVNIRYELNDLHQMVDKLQSDKSVING